MKLKRISRTKILCLILAFLTISSSYMLARYVSSIHSASSASVAKWSVDYASSGSGVLNLVSGNTPGSYTMNVTSLSEVSLNYSIVISQIPSGMEVKIDSGAYQTAGASGIVTFNNAGSFTANDPNSTHTHTITFNAPLDINFPSTNTIDIDVEFIQTD